MTSMARYYLTGIDDEAWKRFKAACNIRGCTVKQSFIDHINIIVAGYDSERLQAEYNYHKQKKGGKNK